MTILPGYEPIAKIRILAFLSILELAFASASYAQLKWDRTVANLYPDVDALAAEANFCFTNTGAEPITILEAKPSCGCTTAILEEKTYGPGERGQITIKLTFGERVGLQSKTVLVRTDAKTDSDATLTMKVTIPELLKATPKWLFWGVNGKTSAKSIVLSAATSDPVKILGITVPDHRISANLTETTPGREYQLSVVPNDVSKPFIGVIRVEIACGEGKSKFVRAFAKISNPSQPVQAPVPPAKEKTPSGPRKP